MSDERLKGAIYTELSRQMPHSNYNLDLIASRVAEAITRPAEAREQALQQRVEELKRDLKVERLALEISGRQSETLEAREQALQKRVEELEELYKLARAEISRLGRQTIDAIAKQNAAEARERELREALQQIVNECSTFPIKPGLAFRCGSIAHAALSTHKEKTS